MIIEFKFKNWMSFKDEVKLSMIASKERQHRESLPYLAKYDLHLLPIVAIYGGNASGKSNLVKAMEFVHDFISERNPPEAPIFVQPFALNPNAKNEPSEFEVLFEINDTMYEFSFAADSKKVHRESLFEVSPSGKKSLRFNRTGNNFDFFKKDQFLEFVGKSTRENELFLSKSIDQNVRYFKPLFDWFSNDFDVILPQSIFGFPRFYVEDEVANEVRDILNSLDTGIMRLGTRKVSSESLPKLKVQSLNENLKEGHESNLFNATGSRRILATKNKGKVLFEELVSYHLGEGGKQVEFGLDQESDGTRRTLDLLPAFIPKVLSNSTTTFVVDELDRSLHHLLTRALIQRYLLSCSKKSRTQLIFTTHDLLLMDQNLLRRDEMYVTERVQNGSTTLFSLSEYKEIRYDKDIRKSYLQGRLGGIPHILLEECRR